MTIKTISNNQYQTPSYNKYAIALGAGYLTKYGTKIAYLELEKPFHNYLTKITQPSDVISLRANIQNALDVSNLKKTNISIIDYSNSDLVDIKELRKKLKAQYPIDKTNFVTRIKSYFKRASFVSKKIRIEKKLNTYKLGQNAGYSPNNKVLINLDKRGLAIFHELGHAMNFHEHGFLNLLQKSRKHLIKIPTLLFIISCLTRKPIEGEKQGTINKIRNFIKNNIGKLTLLSFIPIIIEEFAATLKGNNLAKQVCTPKTAQKVARSNRLAGITYILTGVLLGISAYLGNKVATHITTPKNIQQEFKKNN